VALEELKGAEAATIQNLENKKYMNILLKGKNTLSECFAEIDHEVFQKEFEKAKQYDEKIPPAIKKAIRQQDIPALVNKLFEKTCDHLKSNQVLWE